MHTYIAFLRGVNVGGHDKINMTDLRDTLAAEGLSNVRTYIQSGNVIFDSKETDTDKLAEIVKKVLAKKHDSHVLVVVFSKAEWQHVVDAAPKWWGTDSTRKHNLLILISPLTPADVFAAVGTLKPDIEAMESGDRVVYQSISLQYYSRTTVRKLVMSPVYKQMTIRTFNTVTKLLSLLDA